MDNHSYLDDPKRRAYLIQLLVGGALLPIASAEAAWFSSSKRKLDEDKSIFTMKGEVLVNGNKANRNRRIRAGDSVRTGARSEVVFAVGGDSFILRAESEIELNGLNYLVGSLRVLKSACCRYSPGASRGKH